MEENKQNEEQLLATEAAVETATAHDDFNWNVGRRATPVYSQADFDKYTASYDNTLSALSVGEVVFATVTAVTDSDVVLDINSKADGLISRTEFRDMSDIRQGDRVEVYVETQEDKKGRLVLSRRKAKLLRAWQNLIDSHLNNTIITGTILSKTKGGLIADCGGLETFLPGSQIDIKPVTDYDVYIGKTMEFKVVKINENIKNAVISHKILIEKDLEEQREHIIAGLEKGQVLEGSVKNITDFGAFLDLGGVDGLLYITDISWGRVSHPSEVLSLNQKVNVVVLDFDDNKKRISLGLKQLTPHPWEMVGEIEEGSIINGKVVNVEDYGAFVEIMPGVEGLIHISEVSWGNQTVSSKEFFKKDQMVEAKVVSIDRSDRKMSLSIKQLSADPWTLVADKYAVGSRHTGEVKNVTQYGVFVELENGIGGMVHISDLSWTKRYAHPGEFAKSGDKVDVLILDVDASSRKISLGHKQIEESPWESFETVFPVGSYHEATVVRTDDRGAIVQLPHGLEAFAPIKNIRKEDGTVLAAGDTAMVKVTEFNRDDKRIMVSHRAYLDDVKREHDAQENATKNADAAAERKSISDVQSKVEKETLGDLDALSALKDQLND
jgi:small subunit ribosomal protein S1